MSSALSILLVEEQPLSLAVLLREHGYRCVACTSAHEAVARFIQDPAIELLICSLELESHDGIEVLRTLRNACGPRRYFESIMLTRRGHKQDIIRGLKAGFDDYYVHPLIRHELLDGIARAASSLAQRHRQHHELDNLLTFEAPAGSVLDPLSPRQTDVARLVGKGNTNFQIACELGISENTVKLYVSQILRLTHMHNRTQLALALAPQFASGAR